MALQKLLLERYGALQILFRLPAVALGAVTNPQHIVNIFANPLLHRSMPDNENGLADVSVDTHSRRLVTQLLGVGGQLYSLYLHAWTDLWAVISATRLWRVQLRCLRRLGSDQGS